MSPLSLEPRAAYGNPLMLGHTPYVTIGYGLPANHQRGIIRNLFRQAASAKGAAANLAATVRETRRTAMRRPR